MVKAHTSLKTCSQRSFSVIVGAKTTAKHIHGGSMTRLGRMVQTQHGKIVLSFIWTEFTVASYQTHESVVHVRTSLLVLTKGELTAELDKAWPRRQQTQGVGRLGHVLRLHSLRVTHAQAKTNSIIRVPVRLEVETREDKSA